MVLGVLPYRVCRSRTICVSNGLRRQREISEQVNRLIAVAEKALAAVNRGAGRETVACRRTERLEGRAARMHRAIEAMAKAELLVVREGVGVDGNYLSVTNELRHRAHDFRDRFRTAEKSKLRTRKTYVSALLDMETEVTIRS